jgi:hypothetical protein
MISGSMKGFSSGFLECRLPGSEALIELGVKGLGPALAVRVESTDVPGKAPTPP